MVGVCCGWGGVMGNLLVECRFQGHELAYWKIGWGICFDKYGMFGVYLAGAGVSKQTMFRELLLESECLV